MTPSFRPSFQGSGRFLLVLTVLAAVLRFYRAGTQSIWVDEAETIKYAAVFGPYTWSHFVYNLHGASYAALLHLWSHVFGTTEFALRSLSALLGTLTVPAFFWALRPLDRPRTSLVASGLLAIHPFHVWYSQELRGYVLLILCVIVATGFLLRAREGHPRAFLYYGMANALGLLSNLAHVFALGSHGWAQLLRGRKGRGMWRGLVLSWVGTLVLLTPWIIVFWQTQVRHSGALEPRPIAKEERIRGETSAPIYGVPYTYYTFSVGYSLGPSLRELKVLTESLDLSVLRPHVPIVVFAALAFGFAALVGMVRLWRLGPKGRVWLWLAILPVFLVYGTALRNLKVFNPRYAAAAFPAYVLAISEGIVAVGRRRSLLLGLAVLVPTGTSLAQYYADPNYAKDDLRGATEFLKSEIGPGELLFFVGIDHPLHYYYWRDVREDPGGIAHSGLQYLGSVSREEQLEGFDRSAIGHGTIYVLFVREHWEDPEGRFRRHFEENYEVEEKAVFVGAEVWKLRNPGAGG